jgi:hypothetical protein
VRCSSLRKFRLLLASHPSKPPGPIESTGADTSSGCCRRAPRVAGHRRARSGVTGSAASTRSRSITAGRGWDSASAEPTAAATRSASSGRQRMPRRCGMEGVPKRRARWIPNAAREIRKGARPMRRSPSRTTTTRVSASAGATWRHHAMRRCAREPGRRHATARSSHSSRISSRPDSSSTSSVVTWMTADAGGAAAVVDTPPPDDRCPREGPAAHGDDPGRMKRARVREPPPRRLGVVRAVVGFSLLAHRLRRSST